MTRHELICGPTSPLRAVIERLERAAHSTIPVLLHGEIGTGKSMLARFVHDSGKDAGGPFVVVRCSGVPEAELENKLFGAVAGAAGGTLFLAGIDALPIALQTALLRFLDDGSISRLIAATDADLDAAVVTGRFRRELFFRFGVSVDVPSLRARGSDAAILLRHFLQSRGDARRVDEAVTAACGAYGWPGNVRELQNIADTLIVAGCASIGVRDLPAHVRRALPFHDDARLRLPVDLPAILRDIENELIDAALEQTGGNRQAAANMLGLQRTTLVEKLRRREAATAPRDSLPALVGH